MLGDRPLPVALDKSRELALDLILMDARRTDAADRPGIVASLVGPIAIEATRGNVYGE